MSIPKAREDEVVSDVMPIIHVTVEAATGLRNEIFQQL